MANLFPKGVNRVPQLLVAAVVLLGLAATAIVTYYCTPKYTRVGYQPIQPVPFDHDLHVRQLGMDCRHCHTFVDRSEHSNIPTPSLCMNCHAQILPNSTALAPVREAAASGKPLPWVKIHATPDYVFYNHAVHVNRGISCIHCHDQVNRMNTVYHAKPHSMSFCLDCHRAPEKFIRPPEHVYDLDWKPASEQAQLEMGKKFVHDWKVLPPKSCSGCHR